MERLLVLVVVLSIGITTVAFAATPRNGTFKAGQGTIQRGYDLRFTVDRGGTRIKDVVAHVLEECGGESQIATVGPRLTWRVSNGRFSGRKRDSSDGVTVYTTLEGRFTSPTVAQGTIRQESVVAGSVCDTYKLTFTARP